MNDEPTPQPNPTLAMWQQRIRGAVRCRDPKKLGTLGVLGLATLIMVGRLVLTGSDKPSAATASAVNANGLGTADSRATTAAGRDAGTALPVGASPEMQEWVRGPIEPMGRNLFAIKLDYYPQDGEKIDQTLRAPLGNGFWDKLAKSMASKADQRKERQILVENLQLQAMQLRLQSTVMSATPRALINGSVFREGDVVASFRVLKIEARRIVVEREGIKLEIPMK
jgi:hypothetical protein